MLQAPARFEKVEAELAFVRGQVPSAGWGGGPIVVVLSRDAAPGEAHAIDFQILYQPGSYWFYAEPGSYQLAAYEHLESHPKFNYAVGEPAVLHGDGRSITLGPGARLEEQDLGERFSKRVRLGPRFDVSADNPGTRLDPAWQKLGEVIALDDPRISLEAGHKGLVSADEFIEERATGLFFLEAYDPAKVPVLFVHGLGGAPIQFQAILENLDRQRVQPWLLVYPSIVPVGIVSGILNDLMNVLQEIYRFPRAHVVGHSLGGLVARAYINEYGENSPRSYLANFVSIDTPWGGHAGAGMFPGLPTAGETGSGDAPLRSDPTTDRRASGYVSLVDLAVGSGFLETLFDTPLPPGVAHHLVFGYGGSAAALAPGDGTVTLESQLRMEAQREASSQRGFAASHMGVLESPELIRYLGEVLAASPAR